MSEALLPPDSSSEKSVPLPPAEQTPLPSAQVPPAPPPPSVAAAYPAGLPGVAQKAGGSVVLGFLVTAAAIALCFPAPPLVFIEIWLLPILGVILAIVPRWRRTGLGMLLAFAVGILVLLAVCGGELRGGGFH